jgi:predicted RNA-binding protein with TRAM domain
MSYGRTYGGGSNRFGGGSFGPKPVEAGKEYEVQVTETSRQGDGIARVQGFVIFVKNAKIGQKAKIKVTNVGARFATAELVAATPEQTQPQESQSPQ